MEPDKNTITLPLSVATHVDVVRLLREIETVDESLRQAAIREPGTKVNLPKVSRLMEEMMEANKLNILNEADRKKLITMMIALQKKAPILHISFGADPSPLFIKKLITWLRDEIHPMVLIKIGLQPNLGAGCTLRTTNKFFDFSLRQHFKKQRNLLINELEGGAGG
jgi:F0F1-type ATP synthase delta subunit